jgi:hypothetical protein
MRGAVAVAGIRLVFVLVHEFFEPLLLLDEAAQYRVQRHMLAPLAQQPRSCGVIRLANPDHAIELRHDGTYPV